MLVRKFFVFFTLVINFQSCDSGDQVALNPLNDSNGFSTITGNPGEPEFISIALTINGMSPAADSVTILLSHDVIGCQLSMTNTESILSLNLGLYNYDLVADAVEVLYSAEVYTWEVVVDELDTSDSQSIFCRADIMTANNDSLTFKTPITTVKSLAQNARPQL